MGEKLRTVEESSSIRHKETMSMFDFHNQRFDSLDRKFDILMKEVITGKEEVSEVKKNVCDMFKILEKIDQQIEKMSGK